MSATSGGGGSVSEGSEAGSSSQSTMSVSDSPSTSFQTNNAENVTKITLSEENSAGNFEADMNGSKINLSLDERQQRDGIVNVAFDFEEGTNLGGSGGDFKLINGSEKKDKVPEAVNLELVNMVPYSNGNGTSYGVPVNGIPTKKDSEQVDISTPYDEYFVPVNEHKKYMRGEKLYVTKDKRRPTSWRRCLSWIVACTVISVVLILTILAGTGVILSQEPNLVKEASVGRNFAGPNLKPSVTDKSSTPIAEYVPRTIESEFVIDNLDFDPALKDINSSAYKQFTTTMEDQLKMVLFSKETLEFGASDVGLKIVNISHDPFKVNYRIGWKKQQGVNNPPEPIKIEDVKKRLVESLAKNQDYIDKYHIDREAIKVNHVINTCQMNNGGCSHICYYNYITQQFTCTCPTHLVLDQNGKNCLTWMGPSEDDTAPLPSHTAQPGMPYESTANPAQEQQEHKLNTHYEHDDHHGIHYNFENHNENNFESSTESEFKEHEPVAEPVPEPTSEPSPDPKNGSSLNSEIEHDEQTIHSSLENKDHVAVPEPTAEPNTEGPDHTIYGSKGHAGEHTVDSNNKNQYDPFQSVYGFKDHKPSVEPTPELTNNSDNRNSDRTSLSVFEFKEHEASAESSTESAPEPRSHDHDHSINEFKILEPTGDSSKTPSSEHVTESYAENKDHNFTGKLLPEPVPEPTADGNSNEKKYELTNHSVHITKDLEPAVEPTPEPVPEPTVDGNPDEKKYKHSDHSIYMMKNHEPASKPSLGLAIERNSDGEDHNLANHSTYGFKNHEPAAEPTPEPTAEVTSNYSSEGKTLNHNGSFVLNSMDHETIAEPIPEPTSKPVSDPSVEFDVEEKNSDSVVHYKDPKSSIEPSPEYNSEGSAHPHGTQNEYEFKDHVTVTETINESSTKFNHTKLYSANESTNIQFNPEFKSEKKAKPTEKVTSEFSHMSNLSNSGNSEFNETTIHLSMPQDGNLNSEPNSSLSNSNRQSLPSQDKIQTPESKTEHWMKIHPDMQNELHKNNKSEHHVPYLEDILIKKPSPNSENQNGTNFSQNPLDNIELTLNGEPVIEEILIDKPDRKSTNQVLLSQTGNKSDLTSGSKFEDTDNTYNRKGTVTDYSDESSTKSLIFTTTLGKGSNIQNAVTDQPKITEFSAVQYSAPEKEMELETKKPGSELSENSPYRLNSTTKSNDKNISHLSIHPPRTGSFDDMTINSEREIVNPSQDNVPVTTTQPEIHHEFHTVPVTVEFFNSDVSEVNSESKFNLDNETLTPEVSVREKNTSVEDSNKNLEIFGTNKVFTQTENHTINDQNSSKTPKENETKVHEIATETGEITLLSNQTPEAIEKINKPHAKDLNVGRETIETGNKSNAEQHQIEGNETTKKPEEISNNIKDEVPDNEEFNTLLDKEYKNKEVISNEGKDISKYPSKSYKIEKKKLKDYIKGEKIEFDKKAEVTIAPAVTSEDFILQKHVNGNENTFDLDYSLLNEHTTKHDGEVTVIDPYGIEGIPGVSLKPYGINNHDISVLQTVAPDFRTETIFPNGGQEFETLKPDFKNKLPDNKEGEFKLDKEYKFDKDYKFEKQKVSKKKDLKKKVGGKDGKNVELEEGRKYFTEVSKDDWDAGQEIKNIPETTLNPLEKITIQPETGFKGITGSMDKVTLVPEPTSFKVKSDGPQTVPIPKADSTTVFEMETERQYSAAEYSNVKLANKKTDTDNLKFSENASKLQENDEDLNRTSVNEDGHLMIDEPVVKSTFNISPGTIYDGHLTENTTSDSEIKHVIMNPTFTKEHEISGVPGTVFDGNSQITTVDTVAGTKFGVDTNQGESEQNTTFVVYENTHSPPKIIPESSITNSTTAHPTIIIHGQSGNLQNGHTLRFANSTLHNPGNATVISIINGTLSHPDGHSTFTNYTATFSNGSLVRPTIVVRGQSGTLQDGHELRFGNATFPKFVPSSEMSTRNQIYKNSDVYKIENGSSPGTVFDGHFNPQDGHYHMFTNTSGTFVYTNTSSPSAFIIKGESGDFGNATAYIIGNNTRSAFPEGFTVPHSVIFRNSTVFAVENTGVDAAGIEEIPAQSHEMTSNETIHYTHQMSPSFVSSGTAYEVNNYFGYISKCAAGQFQCVNGTSKRGSACISLSSKCDSVNDCSDGSDELGCIENGCPGNFQCSDNTCLKRNLVCNGILECSDGSDEKNCESWKCEFDEFQCPSGRCIPVVWQCDNKPDCDNHTDEYNCQTSCGNDEYLCPEGWCIPLSYKCNGINECSNGEDEQLCDCSHEEFKCQTGGCVSVKQVCDGLDDCPDRSDEWDCVKLEPGSNLLKIKSFSGNYEPVCADKWSPRFSDEVCASLGYFSSVPVEKENSSTTTETSFYVLKNDMPADFNKKIILNLRKSEGNCSSGKFVEITCQEFSCGSRSMTDSSSVEARLVGGMSATAGQWPSVALLYNIRNFHSCTTNILTPRWALASYNCLKMGNKNLNEQDWKFFGGSTVFEAEEENAETRRILSIIPHPQIKFNQFLFTNDLALVELDQALQFTNNLGAVCLPEQEMQPRQICVTAGWGINASEDKVIRQQLQYLPVPTMNLTECNSTEHYSGFITDDKICAGYNSAQNSLCYNEEGAPLMCVNDRGEWELQGVLSYHSNCGRGSHPSIFSSITPVANWIRKTIGNGFQRKTLVGSNR